MHKATASEKAVINSMQMDFYRNSQTIINSFYLQRLRGPSINKAPERKVHTRDGVIERQVHGAMHAGRVQFYVKILHERLKELFPGYTRYVLKTLANELGLDETQVLTLIRYTALFHDSAREGESNDIWNSQSAKNCYNYFTKIMKLSPTLAEVFTKAAEEKDSRKKYREYLQSKRIEKSKISAFDHIRKLIRLSDCMDIMRCTPQFKFSEVSRTLRHIPGYIALIHDSKIIELLEHVNMLIRSQKDMIVNCEISLTNGKLITVSKSKDNFNLSHKVKFEHAENVCSALGHDMRNDVISQNIWKKNSFYRLNLRLYAQVLTLSCMGLPPRYYQFYVKQDSRSCRQSRCWRNMVWRHLAGRLQEAA